LIPDLLKRLAQADTVFYLLPPIMALLVAGTLAQKYMGLYEAHQKFFAGFYFWAGPVPLPGGYTLIGLLSLALLLQFVLGSEWRWRKSGIHLAHFGALILLLGGLLTALTAREGFMAIPEGLSSSYVYDYHQRTLKIFKGKGEADEPLKTLRFEGLAGRIQDMPFALEVLNRCENCKIEKRAEVQQNLPDDLALRSMAQFMALGPGEVQKESEMNINGLTVAVRGAAKQSNGVYILFEGMPQPAEITLNDGREFLMIFGKQQRRLPFEIELADFVKTDYPGTQMARAYHSDIVVNDGALSFPVRIEMNKPLRYQGYTFYQSSFEISPAGEMTVLSVVKNQGWLFPYVGAGIILAGLLLHLFVTRRGAT